MFSLRFVAVAAFALTSLSLVMAAPTFEKDALLKRDDTPTSALGILNGLNSDTSGHTSSIASIINGGNPTWELLEPHCTSIITLIVAAVAELEILPIGLWDGVGTMPPSYQSCANVLVLIVTNIVGCLSILIATGIPQVSIWIISCYSSLNLCLSVINIILIGVVINVGTLLSTSCVSILLNIKLSLGLVLGLLAL